jgi:RNA polymerase-associated protein
LWKRPPAAKLIEVNPYGSLPTLVDRDLALWESTVVMEYLDERYPHPPLMPVPGGACQQPSADSSYSARLVWVGGLILDSRSKRPPCRGAQGIARKPDRRFATVRRQAFFLSEEQSLVDCCLLPILWRLPILGIELPRPAKPLLDYMERQFAREAFQASLSGVERDMR